MRKFLSVVAMFAASLALSVSVVEDVEAKRFGGGRSIGKQRDSNNYQKQADPAKPAQGANGQPAQQQSGMSRWLGPLAGLAIGGLLASMFMGNGGIGWILLLALAAGIIFMVMRARRQAPAMQRMAMPVVGTQSMPAPVSYPGSSAPASAAALSSAAGTRNIPADFDQEQFLRHAKVNFLRLQAANDAANLDDLREFTSPEVFAEVRLAISERGGAVQHTDVRAVEAALMEVVTEGGLHIASVRFHGEIVEDGEAPKPFDEVWHLTKPVTGNGGWVVAGIQQMQ